ncbi:MAG TPA: AbrB/MazE/SpoVT family DNA-binding domain-containing protein [Thermoanaerobaculia bacterium]|nr:AbrB/MazE/SpoVT family DNA-binding domain-containing protein [Thermoanaerobaculia bacterium]
MPSGEKAQPHTLTVWPPSVTRQLDADCGLASQRSQIRRSAPAADAAPLTISWTRKASCGILVGMKRLTVTAKRQATLPVEVCEDLGIKAGDKIELDRRTIEGESVWVLRAPGRDWSWFAAAKRYARGKSHRWDVIERSIGEAMADDGPRP